MQFIGYNEFELSKSEQLNDVNFYAILREHKFHIKKWAACNEHIYNSIPRLLKNCIIFEKCIFFFV